MAESTARRDAASEPVVNLAVTLAESGGKPDDYGRLTRRTAEPPISKFLVSEGKVATSPGNGFGPGGEGYVRFALIENEQRIAQAVRNLRGVLKLT